MAGLHAKASIVAGLAFIVAACWCCRHAWRWVRTYFAEREPAEYVHSTAAWGFAVRFVLAGIGVELIF